MSKPPTVDLRQLLRARLTGQEKTEIPLAWRDLPLQKADVICNPDGSIDYGASELLARIRHMREGR